MPPSRCSSRSRPPDSPSMTSARSRSASGPSSPRPASGSAAGDPEPRDPMRSISTPDAPKPFGHYSQAVVHGGMVYVAGMLPIDPATLKLVDGGIVPQTERTLKNVEAVLEAAGSDLDRLVS